MPERMRAEMGTVGIVTVDNPLRVEGVNDRVHSIEVSGHNQEVCEY